MPALMLMLVRGAGGSRVWIEWVHRLGLRTGLLFHLSSIVCVAVLRVARTILCVLLTRLLSAPPLSHLDSFDPHRSSGHVHVYLELPILPPGIVPPLVPPAWRGSCASTPEEADRTPCGASSTA